MWMSRDSISKSSRHMIGVFFLGLLPSKMKLLMQIHRMKIAFKLPSRKRVCAERSRRAFAYFRASERKEAMSAALKKGRNELIAEEAAKRAPKRILDVAYAHGPNLA